MGRQEFCNDWRQSPRIKERGPPRAPTPLNVACARDESRSQARIASTIHSRGTCICEGVGAQHDELISPKRSTRRLLTTGKHGTDCLSKNIDGPELQYPQRHRASWLQAFGNRNRPRLGNEQGLRSSLFALQRAAQANERNLLNDEPNLFNIGVAACRSATPRSSPPFGGGDPGLHMPIQCMCVAAARRVTSLSCCHATWR